MPKRAVLQRKGFEFEFRRWLVPKKRPVAVSEQGSPLADSSCGADLDRFTLLSNTEPAQVLPGCEEMLEPPVIAHDAVDDTSGRAHDLGRQQNDGM